MEHKTRIRPGANISTKNNLRDPETVAKVKNAETLIRPLAINSKGTISNWSAEIGFKNNYQALRQASLLFVSLSEILSTIGVQITLNQLNLTENGTSEKKID